MDIIIRNISSKEDMKFFSLIAKRLGLKSKSLSVEEKEDIALVRAIKEAKKGDFVSRDQVMKALRK
jgi:hypothetical protein